MFSWALGGIVYGMINILLLYFVYVYINKKDLSVVKKIIIATIFAPVILLASTRFNLAGFNAVNCEASENIYYTNYYYYFGFFIFLLTILMMILKYRNAESNFKKQIVFLGLGVGFFFISFFIAGYVASLVDNYNIEPYGLFGMTFFMGVLAFMIVKFEAFRIKLLSAQALVATLVILIGSQFAFIRNNTNKILTAVTLALAIGFGWILIRSVKKEVEQREELEIANREIEKSNAEIEKRNKKLKNANKEITERKNQLQKISDSLAIANDQLKLLDNAKTEFVSMASHQLRTPPTPIKGYSSMLLEGSYGELNEGQRKAVENIYNANNQQIAFVEDLLSVSRIESGSMKFEFKKQQIGDLCQEVINNLALKASDKNLYLDYNVIAGPLPELTIDAAKIREVISNLVDNAVKYTIKGGVTLTTELCAKKQETCLSVPHLRVTVSDTGIGVPAEEIPYLFQKFSRGKDTTRLNTGGTGLGLYVVKMITEANGGKVWIESPGANRGTKFILELPLEQEKETLEKHG
jgi:signal transduction histidine kinase